MGATATINARMPESLKHHGTQVLKRNNVSPTELIRGVYRYMEREQRIPECLQDDIGNPEDVFERRRRIVRAMQKPVTIPDGFDVKRARAERIDHKYGDLL